MKLRVLIFAAISAVCLVSGQGLAQEGMTQPGYYEVVGVAEDDVLNVRQFADAQSEIIATLAPHAAPVEVIEVQDGWARVSMGEGDGYVSANYLSPIDLPTMPGSALPQSLVCAGTEPFWSLRFGEGDMYLQNMADEPEIYAITDLSPVGNAGTYASYLVAGRSDEAVVGVVTNRACSDGMSDRTYPREISLIFLKTGNTGSYSGCCYVPINAD